MLLQVRKMLSQITTKQYTVEKKKYIAFWPSKDPNIFSGILFITVHAANVKH